MIMVFDWHSQDSRASGPLEVAHTVTQQYGTGGGNTPMVAHDGLLCRATGQAGAETLTDCAPCLNCDHEAPIVAGCLNPEDNQSRRIYGEGGQAPTLSARESAGAEQTGVLSRSACGPPYIIRRLAPLECGRLQGFPDGWAETAPMDTDDPKEILFWMGVYVTDCKIKGKRVNAEIIKHPAKLARWHDGLHSAAAEYKMWGNGMALPNALFFLQRLQAVMGWCTIRLGSLFDGSGTMPLAAEMCGMRAVWASEVEPYPIAVTRTHLPYMWLEKIKGYCQGAEYWADFSKECEALDIAISALQSNRWRDAKKEPPPEAEDIILTVADGFGRHTAYGEYEGGKWYEYDEDGGMEEANVTQWMPFPDPAEE